MLSVYKLSSVKCRVFYSIISLLFQYLAKNLKNCYNPDIQIPSSNQSIDQTAGLLFVVWLLGIKIRPA
jgi:hypothetical protein